MMLRPDPQIIVNYNKKSQLKIISDILVRKSISTPFFNVGLRMSLNTFQRQYFGALDCADSIVVNEGWSALWRGLPLDVAYVFVFNHYCLPAFNDKKSGLTKGIFWMFICMNLNYCRLLYKLNRSLTMDKLLQVLLKSYTNKKGWIGLAGAAIIVVAQTAFNKFLNYVYSRTQRRWNVHIRGIQITALVYPILCIGCKMIEKTFK